MGKGHTTNMLEIELGVNMKMPLLVVGNFNSSGLLFVKVFKVGRNRHLFETSGKGLTSRGV
jgi:hypothetical protein